jgi:uncharacterized protein YjdB
MQKQSKKEKMKNIKISVLMLGILSAISLAWYGCSKSSSNSNGTSGAVALTIQTSGRSVAPGTSIPFTAVLVDSKGNTSTPTNVTWSAAGSSGTAVGSFNGNVFTATNLGYGTVTASCVVNGTTLTASTVIGVASPGIFVVGPSAIIWTVGAGAIPLTPVYLGTGSTTYSYSSSDATIASVDNMGMVTCNKVGECVINVKADGLTGTPTVQVPVLVIGAPSVTLPVSRISVTPNSNQIFKGETATLTAKAYDMNGTSVSATFNWSVDDATVATVDQTGKVTALKLGNTMVTATASGVTGQAEINVLPDTTVIVTPFWSTIAAGGTQQFTDTVYTVNHATRKLTPISGFSGVTWSIPTYGEPLVDSLFGAATVNSSGLVSVKSSATPGISTFVLATTSSPSIGAGVGMITVAIGGACNCGTLTAGVTGITGVPASAVNLNMSGFPNGNTYQINAQTNITGAPLTYCSNSTTVCSVDASGMVTAISPGTATITVCNGTVSVNFTVNVAL